MSTLANTTIYEPTMVNEAGWNADAESDDTLGAIPVAGR